MDDYPQPPPQSRGTQSNITIQKPMDAEFSKWLEQFTEELLFLEHDLKGEYLDYSQKQPRWICTGDKTMNERGIRYTIGELRSLANKNTYMSNLEEDRGHLYDILLSFSNTMTDNLLLNHEEYELNPRHFDSVIERCMNIGEFALRRPLMAGERRFLKDTTSTVRTVEERNQGGGGLLGGITSIFTRRKGS